MRTGTRLLDYKKNNGIGNAQCQRSKSRLRKVSNLLLAYTRVRMTGRDLQTQPIRIVATLCCVSLTSLTRLDGDKRNDFLPTQIL